MLSFSNLNFKQWLSFSSESHYEQWLYTYGRCEARNGVPENCISKDVINLAGPLDDFERLRLG